MRTVYYIVTKVFIYKKKNLKSLQIPFYQGESTSNFIRYLITSFANSSTMGSDGSETSFLSYKNPNLYGGAMFLHNT